MACITLCERMLTDGWTSLQHLRQQGGPVAKGEALCAIFTGSAGTTAPLLLPTVNTLNALLEGPQSGPYKNALLELHLQMPCR
jgi:hypothetical protein